MAKKKWDFDTLVSGGNEDARDELKRARSKKWAEARHELKPWPYWQQLADSLTEPARQQLLDDLHGWDEATWEHRQHPPKPALPSEGPDKETP